MIAQTTIHDLSSYQLLDSIPQEEVAEVVESSKIATIVDRVLVVKGEKREASLQYTKYGLKLNKYNPILIGTDVFEMGFLGFHGATAVHHVAGVAIASMVFGVIAGGLYIGCGCMELKEAYRAYKNGDMKLFRRMLAMGLVYIAIGLVMILTSIAAKIGMVGLAGFLAANPWLLPLLFFISSLPLIKEVVGRTWNIAFKKDIGSLLNLEQMKNTLQPLQEHLAGTPLSLEALSQDIERIKNEIREKTLKDYDKLDLGENPIEEDISDAATIEAVSRKMEEFQAEIGVDAGLEAFRLWKMILEKKDTFLADEGTEAIKAQIEKLDGKIQEWNKAQKVRLLQQVLVFLLFLVTMGACLPQVKDIAETINGINNIAMAVQRIIPLYMDVKWPFKRNTNLVVEKVDTREAIPLEWAYKR